jgi:hypothetical protein
MDTDDSEKKDSLETTDVDDFTSAAKGAIGAIPVVGPLIAELVGTLIPEQRIDRIAKFVQELGKKVSGLERDYIKSQLRDEHFSDLLEEGFFQASRSLSDERRTYIASLIANSLSSEEIEYQESKYLLRILDEINDVEIIWLWFFVHLTSAAKADARSKHPEVLKPVTTVVNSPQATRDKAALQKSYKEHLVRLGLLDKEKESYSLSSMGRLLLRQVGLIDAL